MPRWNNLLVALALCVGVVSPGLAQSAEQPRLALMGTVPIYWGEAAGLNEMLTGDAPAHWARGVLEEDFTLAPLDYLTHDTLAGHRYLLMAQPRGLSPEENVALDSWVRAGGRLLLFADPMMTGESRFHVGDRRRPQDVALLSPILAYWGLEMHFDVSQPDGTRVVDHMGVPLPVNLRGKLERAEGAQNCRIPGDGLLAHCSIGEGQALVVADAAMLDIADPDSRSERALHHLAAHIFQIFGDETGKGQHAAHEAPENGANSRQTGASHHHHTRAESLNSE